MLFKKILALFLVSCITLASAGCSAGKKEMEEPVSSSSSEARSASGASSSSVSSELETEEDSPAAAVSAMLNAFQKADMEALKTWLPESGTGSTESVQGFVEDAEILLKRISRNMEYRLGETKIEGDSAVVSAVITNQDFSGIVDSLLPVIVEIALSRPNATQEEMGRLVIDKLPDQLEAAAGDPVSTDVDIRLTCTDGVWKAEPTAELLDAVSGGLLGAVSQMAGSLGQLAG